MFLWLLNANTLLQYQWLIGWFISLFFCFFCFISLCSTCCGNDDNNTWSSTSRISTTKYDATGLSNAATAARVILFDANFLTFFIRSICFRTVCPHKIDSKYLHSLITSFDEYSRYAAQPFPNQAMPPYPMPQPQPAVQQGKVKLKLPSFRKKERKKQ